MHLLCACCTVQADTDVHNAIQKLDVDVLSSFAANHQPHPRQSLCDNISPSARHVKTNRQHTLQCLCSKRRLSMKQRHTPHSRKKQQLNQVTRSLSGSDDDGSWDLDDEERDTAADCDHDNDDDGDDDDVAAAFAIVCSNAVTTCQGVAGQHASRAGDGSWGNSDGVSLASDDQYDPMHDTRAVTGDVMNHHQHYDQGNQMDTGDDDDAVDGNEDDDISDPDFVTGTCSFLAATVPCNPDDHAHVVGPMSTEDVSIQEQRDHYLSTGDKDGSQLCCSGLLLRELRETYGIKVSG